MHNLCPGMSENGRRLPRAYLLASVLCLVLFSELSMPGGLLPRRRIEDIIARRTIESLDIVSMDDPNKVVQRAVPIDDVHRKGLPHKGSWIFALDARMHLLLAWRARDSYTCPASWAPLGEHTVSNESFAGAARRGLDEEARFVARPHVYEVGQPFLYYHRYVNDSEHRVDRQWTKMFVVLPRGQALDFRAIKHDDPAHLGVIPENTRYQGMPLAQFARRAMRNHEYFCHQTQVTWLLRCLPLVVRVIEGTAPRQYSQYVQQEWDVLTASGAPVCCPESESVKPIADVNVSKCGVPCSEAAHTPSATA